VNKQAVESAMPKERARRYSIEIKNVATGETVILAAADWTDDEKRLAVARVLRLAGLPDDNCFRSEPERGKARPAAGLALGDDERFIRKLGIGEALQIVEGPAGAGAL
jgi:hypothetical protein